MTICLGALCAQDAGRPCSAAVVASDRMVTLGGLIEFDHSAPKVTRLGLTAVGLIAGDALTGSKLLGDVATSNSGPSDSVGDLASHLARTYAEVRLARAEAALLLPRGLSLQTYYDSHQRLPSPSSWARSISSCASSISGSRSCWWGWTVPAPTCSR